MQYLRDYDPTWPQWFQWIERYLSPRLGKFVCVEHVGSTSIVGMAAKPIIDLDVVVQDGTIIQTIATSKRRAIVTKAISDSRDARRSSRLPIRLVRFHRIIS